MRSIQLPGYLKKKKIALLVLVAHLAVGVLWGDYVAPGVFFFLTYLQYLWEHKYLRSTDTI